MKSKGNTKIATTPETPEQKEIWLLKRRLEKQKSNSDLYRNMWLQVQAETKKIQKMAEEKPLLLTYAALSTAIENAKKEFKVEEKQRHLHPKCALCYNNKSCLAVTMQYKSIRSFCMRASEWNDMPEAPEFQYEPVKVKLAVFCIN